MCATNRFHFQLSSPVLARARPPHSQTKKHEIFAPPLAPPLFARHTQHPPRSVTPAAPSHESISSVYLWCLSPISLPPPPYFVVALLPIAAVVVANLSPPSPPRPLRHTRFHLPSRSAPPPAPHPQLSPSSSSPLTNPSMTFLPLSRRFRLQWRAPRLPPRLSPPPPSSNLVAASPAAPRDAASRRRVSHHQSPSSIPLSSRLPS